MNKKNTLGFILGSAFVATATLVPLAQADQSPFAMRTLDKGYMTADADTTTDMPKAAEAKCSAAKKAAEAKCSAAKKAAEAKCSANKKAAQ